VTGLVAAALGAWLHWHEFTQLAVLTVVLLAIGFLWQLLPGAPVARLALPQQRIVVGTPAPVASLDVQAGAAPMLFAKALVPAGPDAVLLRLPALGPFGRHAEPGVVLPDLPRGVHAVGPVVFERTDPVGVVSRRSESGETLALYVGPAVTDLDVFAGGLANDLDGAASQRLSMSDLAFHALREYVPGDDLRHVHWRSSAKAGELLVRQFHESRRGHVTVLVDRARSSYPDPHDFELAVSAATSIALRAVRDDFDTYLRCGAHVAHGREPVAMTDAGLRVDDLLGEDEGGEVVAALPAVLLGLVESEEAELAHPREDRVGERRLLPLGRVGRELLEREAPDRLAQLLVLVVEDEVLAPRAEVGLEDVGGRGGVRGRADRAGAHGRDSRE